MQSALVLLLRDEHYRETVVAPLDEIVLPTLEGFQGGIIEPLLAFRKRQNPEHHNNAFLIPRLVPSRAISLPLFFLEPI